MEALLIVLILVATLLFVTKLIKLGISLLILGVLALVAYNLLLNNPTGHHILAELTPLFHNFVSLFHKYANSKTYHKVATDVSKIKLYVTSTTKP